MIIREINAEDALGFSVKKNNLHLDLEVHDGSPLTLNYIKLIGKPSYEMCGPDGKFTPWFDGFVLVCICMAGVLVGVQTYEGMEEDSTVKALDNFILVIFTLECLLKIFSEGTAPWLYWLGPEWRWNVSNDIVPLSPHHTHTHTHTSYHILPSLC